VVVEDWFSRVVSELSDSVRVTPMPTEEQGFVFPLCGGFLLDLGQGVLFLLVLLSELILP
jgi:hypothetical protein